MSETDGISEALDSELRAVVMAAAQVAEHAARRAETRTRDLERQATAAAQQLNARRAAERDTARAAVAPTRDPRWWDTAHLDAAARAYATAHAWADHDPQLAGDPARIADRIQDRFGTEARDAVETAAGTGRPTPDQAGLVSQAGPRRGLSAEEQDAAITAHDAAAARSGWDTPERRAAFADSLREVPDPEAVDARVRLDRARAHRASAAVLHKPNVLNLAPAAPTVTGRPILLNGPGRE